MLLHDRVGHGQAEPRPLADVLGREKRIEDLRLHILRYAGPIIGDFEDDRIAIEIMPGADDQHAAAVGADHRLLGVDDQVEQDLLNLVRVGKRLRQASGERLDGRHIVDALLVGAQRQRFPDDLIEIDHRPRGMTLAREGEQVADDLGGAFRLAQDGFKPAPRVIVGRPLRQTLRPREDRRERVVQLVRDARNRLTKRGELLGLQQLMVQIARLILEPLAIADVAHQRFDTETITTALRMRGHLHPHRRSVGATQTQQVISHCAIVLQAAKKAIARLRVDETFDLEWTHLVLGRLNAKAEHEFQVRVGRERLA